MSRPSPAPGWGRFGRARAPHYFRELRSLCGRWARRHDQHGTAGAAPAGACLACAAALEKLAPARVLRTARALLDFVPTGALIVGRELFQELLRLAERGAEGAP